MSPIVLILDLAVALILILCAWRGAAKGLILSLCGLLAVVLAFLGATWVSNQFSEPVSEFISPYVSGYVETLLENSLDQLGLDSIPDNISDAMPSLEIPSDDFVQEMPIDPQAMLKQLLLALQESNLFAGLAESISDAVELGTLELTDSVLQTVSDHLSLQLARAVLFLAAFLLILILWWLISHTLDLAFRLPVLRTFNKAGGLLFGLIKGSLVLLVACWAIRLFEVIPSETVEQTKLFLYFMNFQLI